MVARTSRLDMNVRLRCVNTKPSVLDMNRRNTIDDELERIWVCPEYRSAKVSLSAFSSIGCQGQ